MVKRISAGILALALMTSCVSKKVYTDLETKYADLKKENRALADQNTALEQEKNQLDLQSKDLQAQLDRLKEERDKLAADYTATKSSYDNLKSSYSALEKNSSEALDSNLKKNRELLAQLEAKEKALAAEQDRLNKLKEELQNRSQRVDELEGMIAAQEEGLRRLKETLSNALHGFEGKGLTVEHKNGKVYVSMENKLLFNSGSWTVGAEGKKAVNEVAKVLAANPDIAVLIEGHTDNVPYRSGPLLDNWDLSVKRATSVIRILQNEYGVPPARMTAAGRGEYVPLMPNDTAGGKATNRRTRIVILPQLDQFFKLLENPAKS